MLTNLIPHTTAQISLAIFTRKSGLTLIRNCLKMDATMPSTLTITLSPAARFSERRSQFVMFGNIPRNTGLRIDSTEQARKREQMNTQTVWMSKQRK